MSNTVLLALTLCLVVSLTSGFLFNNNCGRGCRFCTGQLGCTSCEAQFCLKRVNRFGVCLRGCGVGAFCNPVGYCNDCTDSHCDVCTARNQCTRCKSGYTLQNGRYCYRRFGG
ncbi:R-spondin-1-like [Haliotis rufescens]|uniref:R-spondin-1-like n=1 Tax=Haliotis rufescens TaxID=6454 RepID=UPI001EB03244|nr:R-spondin-1-like [Haliotis rufescens]